MKITPITAFRVEGCNSTRTFETMEEARTFAKAQELGQYLDTCYGFRTEEDPYSVASSLVTKYILVPRSPQTSTHDLVKQFTESTGLVADHSILVFLEWIKNEF